RPHLSVVAHDRTRSDRSGVGRVRRPEEAVMDLVVYGDFNCPYSCLASARLDVLVARGVARADWRAVEHDPSIPAPSEPVTGALADELDREIEQLHGLLVPGEAFELRRPPRRPNTAEAVAAFAAAPPERSADLRRALFTALWSQGRDTGDPA